jgi:hypothetical protein
MTTNWEVTVVTDSGFYKKLTLEGYVTQKDAESAAIGMTGGKKVVSIHPGYKAPKTVDYFGEESTNNNSEVVEVHHYYEEPEEDDSEYYNSLDEQEMEMYDLMCQIAMEKGEQLPTISEFYEWLES